MTSLDQNKWFLGSADKTAEFLLFVNTQLPPESEVQYQILHGYCDDWSTVGRICTEFFQYPEGIKSYYEFVNDYNRRMLIDPGNKIYQPIYPYAQGFETFEDYYSYTRTAIRQYVQWVSTNVFHPQKLMLDSIKTSRVRLRVALSKLDNFYIPHELKGDIQIDLIACFYTRKLVFDKYYSEKILELPFVDDTDARWLYEMYHRQDEKPPF